jgi:choline dehydrogenase
LNIALGRFGFTDEYIAQIVEANKNFELIFVYVNLLNPKSKGNVKLRSSNPYDSPKITTGYLTAPEDVNTLVRVAAKLREIVNTKAMQADFAEIVKFNIAECRSLPYPSETYDRCYLKYLTQSGYHPCGTTKMGPAWDPEAVVDERLRVYGIKNLRVVDASIMPKLISANTQATVYMIGEKASDMIKEDWRKQY